MARGHVRGESGFRICGRGATHHAQLADLVVELMEHLKQAVRSNQQAREENAALWRVEAEGLFLCARRRTSAPRLWICRPPLE